VYVSTLAGKQDLCPSCHCSITP